MSTLPEERVLKSLDPVPEDSNVWPDFQLREVKVFYQGKGRYADLLEASEENPLCVVGELMPLDDEQEQLGVSPFPPSYNNVDANADASTKHWSKTLSTYE